MFTLGNNPAGARVTWPASHDGGQQGVVSRGWWETTRASTGQHRERSQHHKPWNSPVETICRWLLSRSLGGAQDQAPIFCEPITVLPIPQSTGAVRCLLAPCIPQPINSPVSSNERPSRQQPRDLSIHGQKGWQIFILKMSHNIPVSKCCTIVRLKTSHKCVPRGICLLTVMMQNLFRNTLCKNHKFLLKCIFNGIVETKQIYSRVALRVLKYRKHD